MFQIIKTGQTIKPSNPTTLTSDLQLLDFDQTKSASPPPLILRTYANSKQYSQGSPNASGTNNSAKRQFIKVNEEVFVSEIKKRPVLYNTHLKDYKRFSGRHEAWSEVAAAVNLSENECKKRWRSLRDSFMKVVRNKDEEERKSWIHYRLLEFLMPYIGKNLYSRSKRIRPLDFSDLDEDTEYVELEDNMEIYEGERREPITVSYVTEDGKEVFQILQDPDTIPEGTVIGIEETEEEDNGENDEEIDGTVHVLTTLHQQQQQIEEHTPSTTSFIYEERLDSTILDIHESYGPSITGKHLFAEEDPNDNVKDESLSEVDGSEIHVEEIEMDSLISEPPETDRMSPEPMNETEMIETMSQTTIQNDNQPSNLEQQETQPIASISVTSNNIVNQSMIVSSIQQPQQVMTPHIPVEQPKEDCVPSSSQMTTFRESQDSGNSKSLCNDADERFLLSCAPILRRLTNKKNQLARLKIQQLLFELEYDEKYSS
ncbi:uncharacterized protein LOC129745133 [Uranotaenia lowii]|uniref:uncharacterized protein LOC129745133 n=1 Tax=Uranotaenia lowii TaxID=190385 RepID=UPI002478A05F|nr:uncharacterized protein LOC129745133 [Uranotaenia lowii]